MYIPLDHLYHWIAGLAAQPVNIYYFYPHGSKNLENVMEYPLKHNRQALIEARTNFNVFCHDQEPLNYDLYEHANYESWISSFNYNNQSLSQLKQLHNSHMTNLNMAVYGANVNIHDATILVHSEKNSNQVDKYAAAGYLPVHYWAHGVIARDWFRFAQHDPRLCFTNIADKDFLIYARDWSNTREYRLKFLDLVGGAQIDNHSLCYFNPISPTAQYHCADHNFRNSDLSIKNLRLTNYHRAAVDASVSADYSAEDHMTSNISVVLETEFDGQRIHLTEKICRALACGHPFMLAAGPFSLDYLRWYGFKTFEPWFDESYDTVTDSVERLTQLVASMTKFSAMNIKDKQKVLAEVRKIAQFNKQYFFSDAFAKKLRDELIHNLDGAFLQASRTRGQKFLTRLNRWKQIKGDKKMIRHPEQAQHLRLIRQSRLRLGSHNNSRPV